MRPVLSIVLYVMSAFLFYTLAGVSFVNRPPLIAKVVILSLFAVLASAFLLAGLVVSRFTMWKRDIGIVLVSASLLTAFIVLTFVCMLATPEIRPQFPDEQLAFFSDYRTGGSVIALMGLGGAALIWSSAARNSSADSRLDHAGSD